MNKQILAGVALILGLSGCKSTEEKAADAALLANCELKISENYQEIEGQVPDSLPELFPRYNYWIGSSLLPLGSRDSAVEEAKLSLCKKGSKYAFVEKDREHHYSAQQKLIGGVYHDYFLAPYGYIDKSEENLVKQLDIWLSSPNVKYSYEHINNLFSIAKSNTNYTTVVPVIEKHIKDAKEFDNSPFHNTFSNMAYDRYLAHYVELIDLYVVFNSSAAKTKLENWVKYHPTSSIKYAAYKSLIELGELSSVENLLAQESNENLKKEVGKLLI